MVGYTVRRAGHWHYSNAADFGHCASGFKFLVPVDQLPHTGFGAERGGVVINVKCKQVCDYPDKMLRAFLILVLLSGFHTDR